MGNPPPPTPNPNASQKPDQLWYAPWISEADYKSTKEAAFGATSTVTGMKADMTFIKAELAGLAVFSAGASVFKFDYTWFKMDEKGVTINGRQRYGWPWADKAKHYNLKAENSFRALKADQEDIRNKLRDLTSARTEAARRNAELDQARDDMNNARRPQHTAASLQAFYDAEKRFKKAEKLAAKANKALAKAEGKAKKLSEEASKRFSEAKRFVRREAAAKKQWEQAGTKVVRDDLNRLRTAVGETEIALGGR
ncbi:hypothetical protein ACF065_07225 [Streptomyces sp. NPDC015232]|uniref:hypothetical protein n=1 Tax=unclassified Streptomyces TaxID=2593676 RepID=UPI003701128A